MMKQLYIILLGEKGVCTAGEKHLKVRDTQMCQGNATVQTGCAGEARWPVKFHIKQKCENWNFIMIRRKLWHKNCQI